MIMMTTTMITMIRTITTTMTTIMRLTLPLPHDTDLVWLVCEAVRVTAEHQFVNFVMMMMMKKASLGDSRNLDNPRECSTG